MTGRFPETTHVQQSRTQDAANPAGSESSPNLLQLALRRKWLLAFLTGIGAALGYLYFTQQPAVYQSRVQLLVTQSRPPLPTDATEVAKDPSQDLATQCLVATSPAVISSAVAIGKLGERPDFGGEQNAVALVSMGLTAAPAQLDKSQTSVMEIAYQGRSPEECLQVVRSVNEAYRKFIEGSEQQISAETVQLIAQAKGDLLEDLKSLEQAYTRFRAEKPLLGQGENKINPSAVRLAEVESELTGLLVRRAALQAKIDAIRDALAKGGSREALALMVNQLNEEGAPKSEAGTVAEKLFPLLLEKELLSEKLGADHPKVQSVEKQILLTRQHLTSLLDQDGGGRPKDLLDVYLDSIGYEIETIAAQEKKLAAVAESESAAARTFEAVLAEDRELTREIDRKSRLLDAIVKRLDEMSLFESRGLRTQVIAAAGPGARVPAKRNEYMAIGAILGFVAATVLAYAIEVSDRSFRSPEDVREELSAPVLGHVPVIAARGSEAAEVSPALCTVHAPKSHMSEAFRLVRTSLFFGNRGGDMRVIQVTSPDQGDGKSTVSSNLAVAIAQSGQRTLLIDADMRRPTVHRLFKTANDVGLSAVIGGAAEPPDAVRETVVPNLSVLTCGERPHNPAELLSSGEFERLLGWARDTYNFVILDTPPLLAVSDPGTVASHVDGVLLTIRLNKRARPKGAEAREILDRVGANLIGIVINGVNAKGEYGYRTSYRYTYSSSYRYGQGYSYASAYTEDASEGPNRLAGRPPVTHAASRRERA